MIEKDSGLARRSLGEGGVSYTGSTSALGPKLNCLSFGGKPTLILMREAL